jgi:hypothetical protein
MKPKNLLKHILDPFRVFAALMLAAGLWLVPLLFRSEPQPALASPLRKDCRVCVGSVEVCTAHDECHSRCVVWAWEPCEGDDPTPPSPPTVSSAVSCTMGSNGWCVDNAQLVVSASDPQGYALTISGSRAGASFSCGGSCSVSLPPGTGTATYTATAATSGLSTSGSKVWSFDPIPPIPLLYLDGVGGANSWYVSPVTASAGGSDSISGLAAATLSADGGAAAASAFLEDGVHSILVTARDVAGNSATLTQNVSVDTVPPSVVIAENGSLGNEGWYLSETTLTAETEDNLSGIASVQHRINGGAWQDGDSVTVQEGVHMIDFRVFDVAGNEQTASQEFHVDTTPPAYTFDPGLAGSVLADIVHLTGTVSDQTSTVQSVEFSSDGKIWQPVSFGGGTWTFDWDSSTFDNGERILYLRAKDVAGNLGEPIPASVILDNIPPYVNLSETWNIWEGGELAVFNNVIPLESIRILVHDPMLRFADQVIYDKLPAPKAVTWDRVIGPASAPPGTYTVTVEVCDIFGLCAKDTGTVVIPDVPTPTLFPSSAPEVPIQRWWPLPPTLPRPDEPEPIQPVVIPPVEVPVQQPVAPVSYPLWTTFLFGLLLLLFTFLLLLDPRPAAYRSLTRRLAESLNR